VEVWSFDEHRLGLKPIIRKIWAPRGCRPTANGHHRFKWLYLYGFVRPATGEVVWFIGAFVNTPVFAAFLAAFAREIGAGPDKHVILVLDGAGWHVSDDLEVPDGIELMFLPPYSPEIQPAERLWTLTDEPLANQYFETLDDLDEVLGQRCRILVDEPDLIRAHTRFHWWPAHN
jgi:transposase